jgi:general secretion pathway protein E
MSDLRAHIQSARRLYRSGSGTVLDVLLRSSGMAPAELAKEIEALSGASALFDALTAQPDFGVIDRSTAAKMKCVPLRWPNAENLRLGLADPWDEEAVQRASALLGRVPEVVALPGSLLRQWLGEGAEAGTHSTPEQINHQAVSGPVVDFVDGAIRAAFTEGASDIHFECDRQRVAVKFRQDGVLVRFAQMEGIERAEEVISRIKVLSQLDITERRVPQDGRFRFEMPVGTLDLRVSIMPSVFGEDAVLRLLDKAQMRGASESVTLDLLGFGADSITRLRELAALPHGMLLVTGPTGSGKTTTVYAALSEINTGLEKIITIEDPVEYELAGVLQIPVNERKGLTFAKGLRSILRHDPDRILVGEIRDSETAEIAVQSALTGHQVFTTVHANSMTDVMGRFRHFGLDMFGFMASLNSVVVQRLVRRVCPHCVKRLPATEPVATWLAACGRPADEVPHAVGCNECRNTGYKGRVVLAEVHVVDDVLRDLVTTSAPVSKIREHVESGVESLQIQAARMVVEGTTTAQEVKRVLGWN